MDKPLKATKATQAVVVEAGKTYYWCACGRSSKVPFCDGSHEGTGIKPSPFTAQESKTVYLCGCQRTKNVPFCDGSHK